MPAATNITKQAMSAYNEVVRTMPTMFLSGFFGKSQDEIYLSDQETVEIDIKRDEELIAIDVIRGGEGNINLQERFSTKEYTVPLYDEVEAITAKQLNKRRPGRTPYELETKETRMAAILAEGLTKMTRKIWRAIEKQAADALFNGSITLVNTETVDFKRKATHNITPANNWSDTLNANPIADIKAACEVNRIDGKGTSNVAIFGSTAWDEFSVHPKVTAYLDNRRIEPGVISPRFAQEGATFQGVMWFGDYRLELYTYPQFYKATEAASATAYVPDEQVVIMDGTARLNKAFAAIDMLPTEERAFREMGMPIVPEMRAADFVPYFYNKPPKSLYVGVQSAPLLIPTAIDTICNLNT